MPFAVRTLLPAAAAILIAGGTVVSSNTAEAAVEGTVTQITTSPAGETVRRAGPTVSADGRYVAFESDNGDVDGGPGVFLLDRAIGTTVLVSRGQDGAVGNGWSNHSRISANGKYVAYTSRATNLTADSAGSTQPLVFRYNVTTGRTTLISKSPRGQLPADISDGASISANGRFVSYSSFGHSLVPGDHNNRADVFRYDAVLDQTIKVSRTLSGGEVDRNAGGGVISPSGRYVAYSTGAQNMGPADTNGSVDTYAYDVATDTTLLASHGESGIAVGKTTPTAVSDAGPVVSMSSTSPRLAPGDTDEDYDVFVYRAPTDSVALVSTGDLASKDGEVSADGRYVLYAGPWAGQGAVSQLYLLDRRADETTNLTAATKGGGAVGALSSTARFVVFLSSSDTGQPELFLWTRTAA